MPHRVRRAAFALDTGALTKALEHLQESGACKRLCRAAGGVSGEQRLLCVPFIFIEISPDRLCRSLAEVKSLGLIPLPYHPAGSAGYQVNVLNLQPAQLGSAHPGIQQ